MTHDRSYRPTGSSPLPEQQAATLPGRSSSSSHLRRPEHPVPSVLGQLQRKEPNAGPKRPTPPALLDLADQGLSGATSSLPHLETIQRSFGPGHDLSGVHGHVGGHAATAAAEMGAQAYAKGGRVAFAETPSLHTAAHEAAHVVQQRAGVQLKGGVGEVGDPYERHADAVADAVVRGESAQGLLDEFSGVDATRSGRAVQHQVLQLEAKAPWGTYHAAPSIVQGTMLDAKGEAIGAPRDDVGPTVDHAMNVSLIASETAKLRLPAGKKPASEQLYTCTTAGNRVEQTRGTTEDPNELARIVEDCLFIDGKPDAADIRQGHISDCYFLAALLGIIHQDPDRLTSMMSVRDGQVTTQLYRRAQGTWFPQLITNPVTLLTMSSGELKGASFRIASAPAESLWYASLDGGLLQIFREDRYECAMWAPMLEKNYADFAQRYGRYGKEELVSSKSGYSIIAGGSTAACYHMFYGNAVLALSDTPVAFEPQSETNIATQNVPALKQLVKLSEATRAPSAKTHPMHFVQARIDDLVPLQRCKSLIELVLRHATDGGVGSAPGEQALADALRPLLAAVDQLITTKSEAGATEVESLARSIQNPSAHPILWASEAQPCYVALRENLGLLTDIGTGPRVERRTLAPLHAYNVQSVAFVDHQGSTLTLSSDHIESRVGDIDPARSTVVLESPWGEGEWDELGTGPRDGRNDGRFTLTLEQLFRNIDILRSATVAQGGA